MSTEIDLSGVMAKFEAFKAARARAEDAYDLAGIAQEASLSALSSHLNQRWWVERCDETRVWSELVDAMAPHDKAIRERNGDEMLLCGGGCSTPAQGYACDLPDGHMSDHRAYVGPKARRARLWPEGVPLENCEFCGLPYPHKRMFITPTERNGETVRVVSCPACLADGWDRQQKPVEGLPCVPPEERRAKRYAEAAEKWPDTES